MAPTKKTKKPTKAPRTKTTTTRTTQQEVPKTKKDEYVAPVIDEDGDVTVEEIPVIEEEEEKFDYANYAVDMTWKPLTFYDELHDVQIQKITVDVESLLQYRLTNLGINPIKIHFVIPYADKTGGRRARRSGDLYKQLTVRVTFRRGMLAKQVNELIHGIVVKPLEIRIAGKVGTYSTAIVGLVRDSGPNRKEMFFPTLAADTVDTAIVDDNGDSLTESETVDTINAIEEQIAAAEQARLDAIADELTNLAGQQVDATDIAGMTDEEIGDIADATGDMDIAINALSKCKKANNGNEKKCSKESDDLATLTLAAKAKILEFSDNGKVPTGEEDEYNEDTTIAVAVIVIVVVVLSLVGIAIFWVRRHKAFDDVYGTAGGRAVYGNPVYGGGAPGAGGDGYLDVGKSFEYPKTQTSETKKKGLIRQESLC